VGLRYVSSVSPASEPTQAAGPGWQADGPRICPIADALELVGDRYALLILRELSFGVRRFSDIRRNTGAPRETLSARLRKLEDASLIARRRYSEHPPRDEYVPTEAGSAITPVLQSLRRWGEQYTPQVSA
jgi:DNA-binding HxlR family transcriptional regulator